MKVFLITPDSEQGLYCMTAKEVGEFVENYILDGSGDGPISFELTISEMTEEEFKNLPDYDG